MTIETTKTLIDSASVRYRQAEDIMHSIFKKRPTINDSVFAHWLDGRNCFWYRRDIFLDEHSDDRTQIGREYWFVDAEAGSRTLAFDHMALAKALETASGKVVNSRDLPLCALRLECFHGSPGVVSQLRFDAFEQSWLFDLETCRCEVLEPVQSLGGGPEEGLCSPDGQRQVFVRKHNLWVRECAGGAERPLTQNGRADNAYSGGRFPGGAVQAVWSPDSRYVFTHQMDRTQVASTPIVEHVPPDGSLRPKLIDHSVAYPEDTHRETYRFVTIEVASGALTAADYPRVPVCRSYGISYLSQEKMGWWSQDGRLAYFVDVEMATQAVRLVACDASTGATRILFEELNSSFVKLRPVPECPLIIPLPATDELVWLSERHGTPHLYLYDLAAGTLKNAITEGEWAVCDVLSIDLEQRKLLLQTTQRHDKTPFYRDICWVGIDTGEIQAVASGDSEYRVYKPDSPAVVTCVHRGWDDPGASGVSPDGRYMVATQSRADTLPVSELISSSGDVLLVLETAELAGLPKQWQRPEPVTLTSADGQSEFYGVVYRPLDFSPDKQYPVLDFSCTHPGFSCIPRSSFANAPYFGRFYIEATAYAALGFIVVSMDGPAEPYRRRAMKQGASEDRLAPVYGYADRKAGIEQLAKRFPYMDLDRVGVVSGVACGDPIYGLLEYPDFYKVGVLSEYEDTRLMPASWEVLFNDFPMCYADEHVQRLKGKLLLIHGVLDQEPPLATTLRLIEAFQAANKDVDLLLLPTVGHDSSNYAIRRIWDYLVTHLQGEEAPKGLELNILPSA